VRKLIAFKIIVIFWRIAISFEAVANSVHAIAFSESQKLLGAGRSSPWKLCNDNQYRSMHPQGTAANRFTLIPIKFCSQSIKINQ
jgi:hypothetical protein